MAMERIQVKLFNRYQRISIGAIQQVGSVFFSQTTNIIVSFIAAKAVVWANDFRLMMALTYIIGQLSAPVEQFIVFVVLFRMRKLV